MPTAYPMVHFLSTTGDLETLRSIARKHGDSVLMTTTEDKTTPLHHAASTGQTKMIEFLVRHNCDVNATDKYGLSPLHRAAAGGYDTAVQTLLKHHADVKLRDDEHGCTALHLACVAGHTRCARALLAADADPNEADANGETPLHKAVAGGFLGLTDMLVAHKVDVNCRDKHLQTPMHKCAAFGFEEVMNFLLEHGAHVAVEDDDRNTPLHYAAHGGHYHICIAILGAMPVVDARNKYGETPLQFAENAKHVECIKLLINEGADIYVRYTKEKRPEKREDTVRAEEDIYSRVDRYGFLIPAWVPFSSKERKKIRRDRRREARRASKWQKLLAGGSLFAPKTRPKLLKLLVKGTPDAVRGQVWRELAHEHNRDQLPEDDDTEIDTDQELEALDLDKILSGQQSSSYVKQIDLDVNRTFRRHLLFRIRYGERQRLLFQVLVAYSLYDPRVGYCQGMSSITAFLLFYMDEHQAFHMLNNLMTKYTMSGLFEPRFPRLFECFYIHDRLLETHEPDIALHLDALGVMVSGYATKWYMLCFLEQLPISLVLRIWDVFLYVGYDFIFCVVMAMLSQLKRQILSFGFEGVLEFVQHSLSTHEFKENKLIRRSLKLFKLYSKQIEALRVEFQSKSESST